MKTLRVLTLVHKGLEPPENSPPQDVATAEWRMEFDVMTTVRALGHEPRVIGVHDDLTPIRSTIDDFKPDITFNLMEAFADVGVFDQNVVSYLELLRVPYTGCNPRGLTLSRDKGLARKLMAYHRIPVPDFFVVPLGRKPQAPKRLKFPMIVKSLTYESSTGISQASVVTNDEQLVRRVQFIHDTIMTPAIVEQFIEGRELYVGVIGNDRLQVFPVWEMSFAQMPENAWRIATERVKWSVKYQKKHGIDTAEAVLPDEVKARIQHVAKRTFRALDLTGYARIDLRMTADHQLFVIEANPNPQLAQREDFAESARRGGVSYARLMERIMTLGLQWRPSRMA
jgi:D-alanine-D-alanine ligase